MFVKKINKYLLAKVWSSGREKNIHMQTTTTVFVYSWMINPQRVLLRCQGFCYAKPPWPPGNPSPLCHSKIQNTKLNRPRHRFSTACSMFYSDI